MPSLFTTNHHNSPLGGSYTRPDTRQRAFLKGPQGEATPSARPAEGRRARHNSRVGCRSGDCRTRRRPTRILAIERPVPGVVDSRFTSQLSADEARRAWELHQAGSIRELFFRADEPAAVLILECGGVDDARKILATLPMVAAELIDFEVIPLRAYSGFARLFASAGS
jgi:muconolactone delta-isomerase